MVIFIRENLFKARMRNMRNIAWLNRFGGSLCGFAFLILASQAQAQVITTITWDEYALADAVNTTIIDTEYQTGGADNTNSPLAPGQGFTVSTSGGANPTVPPVATVYNSNAGTNGNDPDL